MKVEYNFNTEHQIWELAFIDGDKGSFVYLNDPKISRGSLGYLVNWFNQCLRQHEETPPT